LAETHFGLDVEKRALAWRVDQDASSVGITEGEGFQAERLVGMSQRAKVVVGTDELDVVGCCYSLMGRVQGSRHIFAPSSR
jgi:hypothetical protein